MLSGIAKIGKTTIFDWTFLFICLFVYLTMNDNDTLLSSIQTTDGSSSDTAVFVWYVLVAIFGLPGNLLVLAVIGIHRPRRMTSCQMIIFAIGIVDLLGCLNLPLRYQRFFSSDSFPYRAIPFPWCHVAVFTTIAISTMELYLLALAALERYRTVENVNNEPARKTIIVGICACIVIATFSPMFVILYADTNVHRMQCSLTTHTEESQSIIRVAVYVCVFIFPPIAVILVKYIKIALLLRRRVLMWPVPPDSNSPHHPELDSNRRKLDNKVAPNLEISYNCKGSCQSVPGVPGSSKIGISSISLKVQDECSSTPPTDIRHKTIASIHKTPVQHQVRDVQPSTSKSISHISRLFCSVQATTTTITTTTTTTPAPEECCKQVSEYINGTEEDTKTDGQRCSTVEQGQDTIDFESIQLGFLELTHSSIMCNAGNPPMMRDLSDISERRTLKLVAATQQQRQPIVNTWQQLPGAVISDSNSDMVDQIPGVIIRHTINPLLQGGPSSSVDMEIPTIPTFDVAEQSPNQGNHNGRRLYRKVTLMLFIASTVCVLTYCISPLSKILGLDHLEVLKEVIIINYAVNPLIYSIVNECFRDECIELFHSLIQCIRTRIRL